MARAEHDAHPALADLDLDVVPAVEGLADQLVVLVVARRAVELEGLAGFSDADSERSFGGSDPVRTRGAPGGTGLGRVGADVISPVSTGGDGVSGNVRRASTSVR